MKESVPTVGAAVESSRWPDLLAIEVTVLSGGRSDLIALVPEWQALCAEGACTAPFFQPAWVLAYLDAFAPEARLVVLTARANGRLRAILPLVERRLGVGPFALRWLRSASNAHSVRFDLVHGEGDAGAATAAIWNFLASWRGWDILHVRTATEAGPTFRMLAEAAAAGFPTATRGHGEFCTLPMPPPGADPEAIVADQSRSLRKQLRSGLRRLQADGDLQLRFLAPGDDDLSAALEDFYALEASGWKGKSGTAIACDARTRAFYDALSQPGNGSGMLSVCRLELAGKQIAARIGAMDGSCYISLKIAYDEQFRQASPGHLLTLFVLADGARRGFTQLDIGPTGTEGAEYKQAWASAFHPFATCFIFRKSIKGRLAHRFLFRIVPRLQRIRPVAAITGRLFR